MNEVSDCKEVVRMRPLLNRERSPSNANIIYTESRWRVDAIYPLGRVQYITVPRACFKLDDVVGVSVAHVL
jgi:hypothetical protein